MENNTDIRKILDRKILGQDCTEEESAEIKGYLRENWNEAVTPLFLSLMNYFLEEYAEIEEELES